MITLININLKASQSKAREGGGGVREDEESTSITLKNYYKN